MRFIHTADWQIGKPFTQFGDQEGVLRRPDCCGMPGSAVRLPPEDRMVHSSGKCRLGRYAGAGREFRWSSSGSLS
jgi:hypothetical protein